MTDIRPFLDFPAPLTVAIMPDCRFTRATSEMMAKNYPTKEYILHQPMEAVNPKANPGTSAIMSDMMIDQIPWTLSNNFNKIPGAKGMNNHMGSKITADPAMMKRILQYCEQNGYYFLDSLTNARSAAREMAQEVGIHYERRHVFLDNERNEEYITKQFEQACQIANRNGYAIMIGHAWCKETANVLNKAYPFAASEGFTFHVVSELFKESDPHNALRADQVPAKEYVFK